MRKKMRKHLILPSALLIVLLLCGTVSASAEAAEPRETEMLQKKQQKQQKRQKRQRNRTERRRRHRRKKFSRTVPPGRWKK